MVPWPPTFERILRDLAPTLPAGDEISPTSTLSELAIDSLTAIVFFLALEDEYGIVLDEARLEAGFESTLGDLWNVVSSG